MVEASLLVFVALGVLYLYGLSQELVSLQWQRSASSALVRPWFSDLLRNFAIICGQYHTPGVLFFVIAR